MTLRKGRFSPRHNGELVESTVRGAISYVASTFRENDRPNPTKDDDGELGRLLSRQYRAFKNSDPNEKQQPAVPLSVIAEVFKRKATETLSAVDQLTTGAVFFACRSCEYLKVPQQEKRRTDILRLRCIRFHKNGVLLLHSDPNFELADSILLTFE